MSKSDLRWLFPCLHPIHPRRGPRSVRKLTAARRASRAKSRRERRVAADAGVSVRVYRAGAAGG